MNNNINTTCIENHKQKPSNDYPKTTNKKHTKIQESFSSMLDTEILKLKKQDILDEQKNLQNLAKHFSNNNVEITQQRANELNKKYNEICNKLGTKTDINFNDFTENITEKIYLQTKSILLERSNKKS